jgi:hypothetical protein
MDPFFKKKNLNQQLFSNVARRLTSDWHPSVDTKDNTFAGNMRI